MKKNNYNSFKNIKTNNLFQYNLIKKFYIIKKEYKFYKEININLISRAPYCN